MTRKSVGITLCILGVLLVAVSGLADVLGVGQFYRLGTQQILGMILGVVAIAVGVLMWLRSPARQHG